MKASADTALADESAEQSSSPDSEKSVETFTGHPTPYAKTPKEDGAARRTRIRSVIRTVTAPRRWIRSALRWASVGIFVAVVATACYEGWLLYQHHQKNAAAREALDVAQQYAVTLTTADPTTLDQRVTDVVNGATGDFKDRYTKASADLRKVFLDNKVTTKGEVVDSAVKSAATGRVEVMLFVKQTVTNSVIPGPGVDLTAVTITMEKVDGRWLASRVVLPGEWG